MPQTPSELIKEKLDIVEFLRGYLPLTAAGRNWKALCPFHHEKTPSFMVSPERQTWKCFGCNLGGDIFAFVMRHDNVEFGEALRMLAEKAGVELKRASPEEYKYFGLLYDLNEAAKRFFKEQLSRAPVTQKYLAERGLAKETIEEFELGWAPNDPDALTAHFLNSGHSPDDLLRAGLTVKTERRMQFDRFRGRIMFPIHNHFGKVVGFTGRILPLLDRGDVGKYVNSPETPIFNKSRLLYGFWKSKDAIREAGSAFLVEGQTDFLMSWQAGVRNVVASSGTALTPDHLRSLRRLTSRLVISFDNDEAGSAAGERAIDLAEAHDFEVRVAVFQEYKDPAEAAQADPEGLRRAVAEARPAPEFYFNRYLPEGALDHRERGYLKNLRQILGKLKSIASPVERGFWFRELACRTGVAEKALVEEAEKIELKSMPATSGQENEARPESRRFSRWELLSQRILAAAAAKGDFTFLEEVVPHLAAAYQGIFAILRNGERKASDPEVDELINLILLRAEVLPPTEIEELKTHITREYVRERRRELTTLVREAETAGDEGKLRSVLQEFNQLQVL